MFQSTIQRKTTNSVVILPFGGFEKNVSLLLSLVMWFSPFVVLTKFYTMKALYDNGQAETYLLFRRHIHMKMLLVRQCDVKLFLIIQIYLF